jgi:hypothetical protein
VSQAAYCRRLLPALLLLAPAASCTEKAPALGTSTSAAIYGEDDRIEPFEDPDADWQHLAERSVFALFPIWSDWSFCDAAAGEFNAPSLSEAQDLCPGERFGEQPVIAWCSSTLIDDDLVITAAHCVETDDDCANMRLVAGLNYESPGSLRTIRRSNIYQCRRRVVQPDGHDLVIIQLDRPVEAPFVPAVVSTTAVAVDDPLVNIGFPSGIPMKLAGNCTVRKLTPTSSGTDIDSDCDTFPGNSGAGNFSASRELVSVHYGGPGAYKTDASQGGCKILTVYTQDGQLPDIPTASQYSKSEPIGPAIDALCAMSWPTPLCGSTATCGDDLCTGSETVASCPADCQPRSCGDGICDPDEDYTCAADCGDRDFTQDCVGPSDGVPDAGVGPDAGDTPDGDDSGCGCAANTTSSGRSLLLLCGVVAVMLGRRRRRSAAA